jgi:hypothetical protein
MILALHPLQYITKTLTLKSLGLPFMHACCSSFHLSLSSCMFSFPKMPFFSTLASLQKAPKTDMCLVPSHLTLLCFLDLLGDRLELFLEICFLCMRLHSLLIECVTVWTTTSSLINSTQFA